jgi:hypothetical protein
MISCLAMHIYFWLTGLLLSFFCQFAFIDQALTGLDCVTRLLVSKLKCMQANSGLHA